MRWILSSLSRQVKKHPGLVPLIGFTCLGITNATIYLLGKEEGARTMVQMRSRLQTSRGEVLKTPPICGFCGAVLSLQMAHIISI
ncbi:NADH dehydrogenase [ubiquinone] 1 alpha subcomplex subunit 4-like 2 [Ascaphus truei]|uniref:NADH dehydrogenase [ubiquinone] 1 alpha subcomplex subunit 4-like 2 n=1 Tax=Ascaphus truei TaxID=8439 RepID=UPI003F5A20B2